MRVLQQLIVVGATVLLTAVPLRAQDARSLLSERLSECGCLIPGMPLALLSTEVSEAQSFKDNDGFVLAYFRYPRDGNDPIHVIAGNVELGTWKYAELPVDESSSDAGRRSGPIWTIRRMRGFIVVGLRVAIDGIAESVLNRDLTRLVTTYGVIKTILPDGVVLYEHAQPHFAPTHYVELAALDIESKHEVDIYPRKPYDRVRRQAIDEDRRRYARLGEEWCRVNNQHCDPELFDNNLMIEDVEVNEKTRVFAFGVAYGQGVVTVCTDWRRLDSIECHETRLLDWQRLFPGQTPQQILAHAAAEPRRVQWR